MTIRVGIIGAGAIADDHCTSVSKYQGAELVAVSDISRERRESVKQKYGMAQAYEKWQDLVADSDVDAVMIALPNALHAPVSVAALKAGKHVLLEKPFALSYREAKQVAVERAAQAVLDARDAHPEASLADLYDPLAMPANLTKAHTKLDRAVDRCYRSQRFPNERNRVEYLFKLYQKLTAPLLPTTQKGRKR